MLEEVFVAAFPGVEQVEPVEGVAAFGTERLG
jgi:hypothetical protein